MPDLLTHALLAYTVAQLLAWRIGWITPAHTTVAMAGAFIPDVAKIDLLVPGVSIESLLGIPFSWFAIHTAGGAVVAALVGALLVDPSERRRVLGLLCLGAATHLLADALLLTPSGRSYAILWPLTRYHPPTPGLYLSTRPGPVTTHDSARLPTREIPARGLTFNLRRSNATDRVCIGATCWPL